jgi:hypothetical protein
VSDELGRWRTSTIAHTGKPARRPSHNAHDRAGRHVTWVSGLMAGMPLHVENAPTPTVSHSRSASASTPARWWPGSSARTSSATTVGRHREHRQPDGVARGARLHPGHRSDLPAPAGQLPVPAARTGGRQG